MDRRFSDEETGIALIGVAGEDCGRIVRVNRALAALLATTPDELVGTSICDCIHSADRARAADEFTRLIAGAIFCEGEGRLLAKDGRVRPVRVFAGLLPPDADDSARAVAMLHIAQIADRHERPYAREE